MRSNYRDQAELLEESGKLKEAAKLWHKHAELCDRLANSFDKKQAVIAQQAREFTNHAISRINQQMQNL